MSSSVAMNGEKSGTSVMMEFLNVTSDSNWGFSIENVLVFPIQTNNLEMPGGDLDIGVSDWGQMAMGLLSSAFCFCDPIPDFGVRSLV